MIKCGKCGNTDKFLEIHCGGYREHEWQQEGNGRMVFCSSNYDKAEDTLFECGYCHEDLSNQYRKFLQLLSAIYRLE